MSNVREEEFLALQSELVALKGRLYEEKEAAARREKKLTQDLALAKASQQNDSHTASASLSASYSNSSAFSSTLSSLSSFTGILGTSSSSIGQATSALPSTGNSPSSELSEDLRRQFEKQVEQLKSDHKEALEAQKRNTASLARRNADLSEELNSLRTTIAELRAEVERKADENMILRNRLAQLEQEAEEQAKSKTTRDVADDSTKAEVERLTAMNATLIEAVQKKDKQTREAKEDVESVLMKLSDREQEIMKLRDEVSKVSTLERKLKESEAKNKKLAAHALAQGTSAALSLQVKSLTEALAAANTEKTALESEVRRNRATIHTTSTDLEQTTRRAAEAEMALELANQEVEETKQALDQLGQDSSAELERVRATAKEHTERLEYEHSVAKAALARGLEQLQTALQEEKMAKAKALEDLAVRTEKCTRAQMDLEAARSSESSLQAQLEVAQQKLQELEAAREDDGLEREIEARKRNHMVIELKAQLKRNTVRISELQAKIQAKDDTIASLSSNHVPAALTQNGTLSSLSGSSSPTALPGPPASPDVSAVEHEVDHEVSTHLASKLEQSQNLIHDYKRQLVQYKEMNQLLQEDVMQKRDMIRHLVRNVESGALSTPEMIQNQKDKAAQYALTPPQHLMEILLKTEIVCQESTLQNHHLRRNMATMGEEMTRLLSDIDLFKAHTQALEKHILSLGGTPSSIPAFAGLSENPAVSVKDTEDMHRVSQTEHAIGFGAPTGEQGRTSSAGSPVPYEAPVSIETTIRQMLHINTPSDNLFPATACNKSGRNSLHRIHPRSVDGDQPGPDIGMRKRD
eukprot:g21280.t1